MPITAVLPSRNVQWLAGLLFGAGALQWLALPAGSDGFRVWILSAWSVASLVVALVLAWEWHWLRIGLSVFAATLVLGWTRGLGSPAASTHFAGASLGLLWMAIVGRQAVTPGRLTLGLLLFLGVAAMALVVGMAGVPAFFPPDTYSVVTGDLSILRRALISAEATEVNQNALAALALLVCPVAASSVWLRGQPRAQQLLLQAFGAVVFLGGAWILMVTRSRTALLAAWLLLLVVLVRGCRWWVWRMLTGALAAAIPLAGLGWIYQVPRERVLDAVGRLYYILQDRMHILLFAAQTWADNLWLGIGLNEFRHVYAASHGLGDITAHAHNVFLQIGLDVGLIGLIAYCAVFGLLLVRADQASRGPIAIARTAAAGSAFSLIAVHLFGLADAVSLGAKIGVLQWMAGGLILGSWRMQHATEAAPDTVLPDRSNGAPARTVG